LPSIFAKALGEAKEMGREVSRLWSQMLPGLAASAEVVETERSKIGVHVGEIPPSLLAKMAGMIAERIEGAGVAVSGTRIAISSRTLDAGGLLEKIQRMAGGKGGGSPKTANGSLGRTVTADEILVVLRS
jgi:alanyl-tRNA synthetase